VNDLPFFLIVLAGVTLTAASAFAQHKYYARTIRRLAAAHDEPGCVLVSGRGKGRIRGAVVELVLRASDEQVMAAAVMEGATVFARFRDRPDWVGLSARDPSPAAPRASWPRSPTPGPACRAGARPLRDRGPPRCAGLARYVRPGRRPPGP
jgi:glucitol operon activator protein